MISGTAMKSSIKHRAILLPVGREPEIIEVGGYDDICAALGGRAICCNNTNLVVRPGDMSLLGRYWHLEDCAELPANRRVRGRTAKGWELDLHGPVLIAFTIEPTRKLCSLAPEDEARMVAAVASLPKRGAIQ